LLLSDPVLEVLRRELRRLSPGIRIDAEEVRKALSEEVIKREVLDGEKAEDARKRVGRASSRAIRKSADKSEVEAPTSTTNPSVTEGQPKA